MVKTAKSRAHARRILGNWIQSCKDTKDPLSPLIGGKRPSFTLGEIGVKEFNKLSQLSFGKIFKQDPWDCGKPGCNYCSSWQLEDDIKRRASLREDEREAWLDLFHQG